MPRKSKLKQFGGSNTQGLRSIATAEKNIHLVTRLLNGPPPKQKPGQIVQSGSGRHYGGSNNQPALRDRFGAYLYIPHT